MNSTLAVILVLVAILSPFVGTPTTNVAAVAAVPAAQQPAVAQSHAGRTPPESWLITWKASTQGWGESEDEGEKVIARRQSNVVASIVVNYYTDGSSEYIVNEYIATYSVYGERRSPCEQGGSSVGISRHEVTEPKRYNRTGPVTPNTEELRARCHL